MTLNCEYFRREICRSCTLLEVDYESQIRSKEERVSAALKSFPAWTLLPSVTSRESGFRNKAKFVVSGSHESPVIGLIDREILSCPVHHPKINEALNSLAAFIRLARLAPYDIATRSGELKGLILYYSEESNEAYVRFVLRSREALDRIKKHLTHLSDFHAVTVNIQPIHQAILEGEEEIVLSENGFINHDMGDVRMRLGTKGFVQTNQVMAAKLYRTAASWVKESGAKRFAELFSGQGGFSFHAPAEECVGFEVNSDAVTEANATAVRLGLNNIKFHCSDAASVEADLIAFKPDLVLVNPPRRGLGLAKEIFQRNTFPSLIYSSCSIETLAADLEDLRGMYDVLQAQMFDMFPHTTHFETLVLLKARA